MPIPPLASDVLHLGEFVPPVSACVLYLTLYGVRARTLRREGRPVVGWLGWLFLRFAARMTSDMRSSTSHTATTSS